ncbi:Uncharacterised protein [Vibrio cholerae]|nr:Uncharacterised protein [Vibrio cholerae]
MPTLKLKVAAYYCSRVVTSILGYQNQTYKMQSLISKV